MITRDWIISVLEQLEVWYWPVFFWELMGLRAWLATEPLEPGEMLVVAATRTGRIVIDAFYPAPRPDPADWTAHAPRRPWERLNPEPVIPGCALILSLSKDEAAMRSDDTAMTPSRHHGDTVLTPAFGALKPP